jgi:hypothetical protein
MKFVSTIIFCAFVTTKGSSFAASETTADPVAPAASSIPEYLSTGIAKLTADAGKMYAPQAELMIALVATGHVGKNLHAHRMQLMQSKIAGNPAAVHNAKRKAIMPLAEVFQSVENAHKNILRQIQNPYPSEMIIDGLAEAMLLIKSSCDVLERLSRNPNAVVSGFYMELSEVLERALGLKEYLKAVLPILFDDESIAAVVVVKPEQAEKNTHTVNTVNAGYSELIANGATNALLSRAFARVEFDRVWDN